MTSERASLPYVLHPIEVGLDQLLLDPNNPRFSELGEQLGAIPESRFADARVQASTFEKMKVGMFDVVELRDTIKSLGFLPMDRIVIRKWSGGKENPGGQRYVVVEGNRRTTALKWLVELHDVGKESFSADQLANFKTLECLLLDDAVAPASATLILPGLRHVSGVKEWGAYQKAKAVHALRKSGLNAQEAAQSFGLSTRTANSAYRCFLALEQMKGDEEFGDYAEPKMYTYFEEVLRRPNVRAWLEWSDEHEQFDNFERLHEFYSWMVPNAEDGQPAKLPESRSVRDLSQIISDDGAMNILRSPEGNLSRALARYEVDHPEDWFPKITAALTALKGLTPDILRSMDEATVQTLMELKKRIEDTINDRHLLVAN